MALDKDTLDQILKDITNTGYSLEENRSVNLVLASRSNLTTILDSSSGLPKVKASIAKQFKLVLSIPLALQAFNPFEIRCCLCHKVIMYPAWYYMVRFAVNEFHYFICFDRHSANKVTARCYKR